MRCQPTAPRGEDRLALLRMPRRNARAAAALWFHGLRSVARFALPLVALGSKLDRFVLGRFPAPAEVDLSGTCSQLAAVLPHLRTYLDPIAHQATGADAPVHGECRGAAEGVGVRSAVRMRRVPMRDR